MVVESSVGSHPGRNTGFGESGTHPQYYQDRPEAYAGSLHGAEGHCSADTLCDADLRLDPRRYGAEGKKRLTL